MKKFISAAVAAFCLSATASANDVEFLLPNLSSTETPLPALPVSKSSIPKDVQITKDNTILLRGPISGSTASSVTEQLLTATSREVYLFIDSPGGSVLAAARIIAAMRSSEKRVVCVAETAISAAFMILQACDVRLITYSGVTMQHNASLAVGRKEIPNFKTFTAFIYRMLDITDAFQAKRLGIPVEEFKEKTKDDWWLFSIDAVSNNVVDGMTSVKCSKDAIASAVSIFVQSFFGEMEFKFSKCPLLSSPLQEKDETRKIAPEHQNYSEIFNSREPIRDPLYMEGLK